MVLLMNMKKYLKLKKDNQKVAFEEVYETT